MSFRLVPKSVTLTDLERRNATLASAGKKRGRRVSVCPSICQKSVFY